MVPIPVFLLYCAIAAYFAFMCGWVFGCRMGREYPGGAIKLAPNKGEEKCAS